MTATSSAWHRVPLSYRGFRVRRDSRATPDFHVVCMSHHTVAVNSAIGDLGRLSPSRHACERHGGASLFAGSGSEVMDA